MRVVSVLAAGRVCVAVSRVVVEKADYTVRGGGFADDLLLFSRLAL